MALRLKEPARSKKYAETFHGLLNQLISKNKYFKISLKKTRLGKLMVSRLSCREVKHSAERAQNQQVYGFTSKHNRILECN